MALATVPQCGIYCITCLPTGLVYVGSSNKIPRRWTIHRWLLRKNNHDNPRLQNAYNKHGKDCFQFSVLELVADPLRLIQREQHWIDSLRSAVPEFGFNTAPVAGSRRGVPQPPGHSEFLRALHRGRKVSVEARDKIRAARNWEKRSPASFAAGGEKRRGRKLRPETIAKMCAIRSGRPQRSKRAMTFETAGEIRRLRLEDGLSQGALAARFGCSRKSIREILAGNTYTAP